MRKIIETVSSEIKEVLTNVREEEAIALSVQIAEAKRVFVFGEGRSGLMAKAFAMRLMHGGYSVYAVGETVTPSIQKDDLLIIVSGSGSSAMICSLVETVKQEGALLALVTTNVDSDVAKRSDSVLVVPAVTKQCLNSETRTIQPLGNQFDQSVHLLLDSIIIYTLSQAEEGTTYEVMKKNHTNLE